MMTEILLESVNILQRAEPKVEIGSKRMEETM
jgi:hypothetical protein